MAYTFNQTRDRRAAFFSYRGASKVHKEKNKVANQWYRWRVVTLEVGQVKRRDQSERVRAPGLVRAEALSVGDEGGHLQEGTVVLGSTGGQPGKERV